MKHSIDFWQIIHWEGGVVCHGYVPDLGHSQSGVTIGGGVDLGCRSLKGVSSLGLSPKIVDKIAPYLGKKQYKANQLLTDIPLLLTKDEAMELTLLVKNEMITRLIAEYHTESGFHFETIHPAIQTIVASLYYQYGRLKHRCPVFWGQAITLDIVGMYRNLCNFGDRYKTRRSAEANYLNSKLVIKQ